MGIPTLYIANALRQLADEYERLDDIDHTVSPDAARWRPHQHQ